MKIENELLHSYMPWRTTLIENGLPQCWNVMNEKKYEHRRKALPPCLVIADGAWRAGEGGEITQR